MAMCGDFQMVFFFFFLATPSDSGQQREGKEIYFEHYSFKVQLLLVKLMPEENLN